jgi:CheY-like chemotaxis protein
MLLNDEDLSPSERKQYAFYIKESSESMLALVNSILDWTRLQTGRIRFEPEKVMVNEIIRKAINSSRGFAMKKKINLIDELSSEYFVFIDPGLILQVFNNLISNAMKFTPAGGTIAIKAVQSQEPRFIELTVSDTGVGIAEENIPKIFSIESKFTTLGTNGEKGTGLGLSLVREIVEKHGGKIWVESELDKGTDFKFWLPKASAKILLIDDSNTDRILYSKLLKSIIPDYEIITARNGLEGFNAVVESAPALVVTDHLMPEMNGYEFVKKLVDSGIKGKPPVIVLSADIRKGEILAYNELGVEYIFTKPVNLNTLKDAIQSSLKKFII